MQPQRSQETKERARQINGIIHSVLQSVSHFLQWLVFVPASWNDGQTKVKLAMETSRMWSTRLRQKGVSIATWSLGEAVPYHAYLCSMLASFHNGNERILLARKMAKLQVRHAASSHHKYCIFGLVWPYVNERISTKLGCLEIKAISKQNLKILLLCLQIKEEDRGKSWVCAESNLFSYSPFMYSTGTLVPMQKEWLLTRCWNPWYGCLLLFKEWPDRSVLSRIDRVLLRHVLFRQHCAISNFRPWKAVIRLYVIVLLLYRL